MRDTLAVILGGGAGTRLFPLTHHRSKPAVPLAGKYRLIDIPISNCVNSELMRMFVVTQYNSASLNRHVARAYRFDRFGHGFVTVLAAEQTPDSHEWFQGTADAVRQCLPHINPHPHRRVLILSGDQLYRMDFNTFAAHHRSTWADLTVATIPVTAEDASAFGILKTDADGVITEFHEKPTPEELPGLESPVSAKMKEQGRVYLASMGIYMFERDVLREVLLTDESQKDFGKEIIPAAIASRRVVSYPFDGYWSDIGTVRSFYEANIALAQPDPEFDLYDAEAPIYSNARMLPPAKIQNSHVRNSMIAEAAVITDATVEDSVVGLRSFISPGATLRRTVMLGADYHPWLDASRRPGLNPPPHPGIGPNSTVEGAIIDKNVQVGADCRITNADGVSEADGDGWYIRDGVIVLQKDAIIPDGTVI
ncbi:glucose-1-phosphate adenylyltransferase [Rubrivirga sp. SAORIC476]|uniref:glucose-1-phosphate adenylyltransferase n=1 Tax=Rubrivirga sp. SAORIC476 TaxID=1961794 RepID=UPI000BA97060|nr:glucose-1-phosphate adenylyltransferase [Rubrivirga sp. SAORIC476]PAP79738.1 glucose-1-phosphate adenylyltransferase [Rubrivirga sp. SAORIC476]